MTVATRVASAVTRPLRRRPEHTRTLSASERRLADLESALVDDVELLHDCRWQAHAAHQRIANRRPEIDRLRAELGVAP